MGLIKNLPDVFTDTKTCTGCEKRKASLYYLGYAEDQAFVFLCAFCATQLARKILEDVCDLNGDRHG